MDSKTEQQVNSDVNSFRMFHLQVEDLKRKLEGFEKTRAEYNQAVAARDAFYASLGGNKE